MLFTVLNIQTKKYYGKYYADAVSYKAPFEDRTIYIHHEVSEGNYAEGYYLDEENNVLYDFSYTEPVNPYTVTKIYDLEEKEISIKELMREEAAINSQMLNELLVDETDPETIYNIIRTNLDNFVEQTKPLLYDLSVYYYWRIDEHAANIVRDDVLLTEERIQSLVAKLKLIVE